MRKKNVKEWVVAVLGAGTMGNRITQLFAMHGHKVKLYNRTASKLGPAIASIESNMRTMVEMGMMRSADDIPAAMKNIETTSEIKEAVQGADYIIENVAEDVAVKQAVYAEIDKYCAADAIVASDTSTMDIFKHIQISHPERFVITHFFLPANVMPLVELVRGPETSDEVVAVCKEFLVSAGKTVAVLNKVIPGFIMNRITFSALREAVNIVEQGVASPEDVDAAIVATWGPRFAFEGPFQFSDFGGWDTWIHICSHLFPVLSNAQKLPDSIYEMVAKGEVGVKAGKGIWAWKNPLDSFHKRDTKIIKMIQVIKAVKDEVGPY